MVVDPEKVREIARTLSDEYSRKILAATIEQAKSPEEISNEQAIPGSTCYRRIHELVSLSMIRVRRVVLTDGKKVFFYKSVYKQIRVKFELNELSVELVPNTSFSPYNLEDMRENTKGKTNCVILPRLS